MDPATEAAAATRRRILRAIAAPTLLFFFLAAVGQLLPKSFLAEHALSVEKRVKAIPAVVVDVIGTNLSGSPALTWDDSKSATKSSLDCSVHTYWPTGRLKTNEYADGSTMSFGYDPNGNLTTRTKRDGTQISYTYDNRNRLRITTLGSGRQIFADYNTTGLLTSVRDTETGQITYGHDLAQRVTSTTKANGQTIDYGHDPAGRVNSLTTAAGTQSWTYDGAGRTKTATDFSGQTAMLSYDTAGRLSTLARPGAAGTTAISYDTAGRITRVNSGPSLGDFEYATDAVGNRVAMTETLGGYSDVVDYEYDPLNRLTKESRRSGSVNEFSYDAVGNRTKATGQPDRAYDALDQVIGWDYDANGNLLADDEATYAFDELDRLTSVTKPGTGYTSSFTWDGEGNLLDQTQNGQTRSLVVDSQSGLARVLQERDPADNAVTASYSYCSASCTRVMSVANSAGHRWAFTDALGSIRTLGDDAGNATDAKTYDAYGEPGPFATGTNSQPYAFAGERLDRSGLYWNRARWYNPSAGQFLSRDPRLTIDSAMSSRMPVSLLSQIDNPYAYGFGNPVGVVDPTGEMGEFSAWGQSVISSIQSTLRRINIRAQLFVIQHAQKVVDVIEFVVGLYTGYPGSPSLRIGSLGDEAAAVSRIGRLRNILTDARTGTGIRGIGRATAQESDELGRAFVGKGWRPSSDGKAWVSADELRQYRPTSWKKNLGKYQSNFERRSVPKGSWDLSNGHLDVVDEP